MYTVAEEFKTKRRWVDDYVTKLDPEKDYAEIMSVVAQHQMDEFVLHFLITGTNITVIMPAYGAEAQVFTNKALRRPVKRMQDTLGFFWTWYANGPDHPDTIKSVQNLNKIHMGVAKHVPGHFTESSDYVYTMAYIALAEDRLLKKLGLGGAPEYRRIAHFNFMKELSKHFRREGDLEVEGFPQTLEEMEAFAEEWERWDHEYSPVQTDLVNGLIHAFGARWFPAPLQPLGRWLITYTIADHVLEHYRIPPLRGIRRMIAHRLLKTIFSVKMKYAPDSKTSFLEKRKLLSRDEYLPMDAKAAARADKFGWHKGGLAAVGLGNKGGRVGPPAGMCPVVHDASATDYAATGQG